MFWSPNSAPQQVFKLSYRKRIGDERTNVPLFLLSHTHVHTHYDRKGNFSALFLTAPVPRRQPSSHQPLSVPAPLRPAPNAHARPSLRRAGSGSRTLPQHAEQKTTSGENGGAGRPLSPRERPEHPAAAAWGGTGQGPARPPALPAVPRRTEPPARPLRERSRGRRPPHAGPAGEGRPRAPPAVPRRSTPHTPGSARRRGSGCPPRGTAIHSHPSSPLPCPARAAAAPRGDGDCRRPAALTPPPSRLRTAPPQEVPPSAGGRGGRRTGPPRAPGGHLNGGQKRSLCSTGPFPFTPSAAAQKGGERGQSPVRARRAERGEEKHLPSEAAAQARVVVAQITHPDTTLYKMTEVIHMTKH